MTNQTIKTADAPDELNITVYSRNTQRVYSTKYGSIEAKVDINMYDAVNRVTRSIERFLNRVGLVDPKINIWPANARTNGFALDVATQAARRTWCNVGVKSIYNKYDEEVVVATLTPESKVQAAKEA